MSKRGNSEGSVYKRKDGRWAGAFVLPDGRRKVIYSKTRVEVSGKLRDAQQQVANGLPLAAGRETLAGYLPLWLEDFARPSVRPRTFEGYASVCRQHLIPQMGRIRLAQLSPGHVQKFMNTQRGKGLSARSVQWHHAVLRRALRDAERLSLVQRNVARLVTPPRVEQAEIHPITSDQARQFLDATSVHRLYPLFVLAFSTGARQGELLALAWDDVDLEGGTLSIRATLHRRGGEFLREQPKTKTSRRTLALAPQAVAELRAHRARQAEMRLRVGNAWQATEWGPVFTDDLGQPLVGYGVTRAFQSALAAAGLPRQRFHDMRHALATYMLSQHVPLKVVQTVLGHSTIAVTSATYAHVMPDLERDAVERVAGVLWAS